VSFTGFPPAAFEFYDGLEADNSKAFWQANKGTFEDAVKAPMLALCEELADVGPFHVFRPYNDLRFAKNRPPYKTHQGAYCESEGGAGHYFHLGADGMTVAVGYYNMAKDQLERFRAAVDDDRSGPEIERIVATMSKQGYSIGAMDELKSAPRGYARDHPRVELLRRKGLTASKHFPPSAWMHTKKAVGKIRETWSGAAPMCGWLDARVGPSTIPPEDAPIGSRA
jgi:uncharacterized protein (TIGR02453 family)